MATELETEAGEVHPEDPKPEKPAKARNKNPALTSLVVYLIAKALHATLRYRQNDRSKLLQIAKEHNGAIAVVWHGRSLVVADVLKGVGCWALISLSRDGEIQNGIFTRFGFQTIRGSTGRGGARATIQLVKKIQDGGVLVFTPDGPRGPTHKVQQGTVFMAQRTGRPIIPIGTSVSPRKILPTWDSYILPYPFAKTAFVVGEPIFVPADLDDAGKQAMAEQIETALNDVQARAEIAVGAKTES